MQDPNAALALVSARPEGTRETQEQQTENAEENDPDMKRAKDLLELHSSVKVSHQAGTNRELDKAREDVAKVMRTL